MNGRGERDAPSEAATPDEEAGDRLDLTFFALIAAVSAFTVALDLELLPRSKPVLIAGLGLVAALVGCGLALFVRWGRRRGSWEFD
jgi:hypothetical protein